MQNLLLIISTIMFLGLVSLSFAYDNGDGTHTVETYMRSNGTTVYEHNAGNPGSGIHCQNNVCY